MAMEIALRYIATAVVIGAAVWYYGGFDRVINQYYPKTSPAIRNEPVEKTAKKKKARNKLNEPLHSGTDSASLNERKRKISSPVAGTVTTSTSGKDQNVSLPRVEEGDVADKDWARGLQRAQQGISFKSSSTQNGAKSKSRTVKQSTADEDSRNASAENSSTGQDGDDETTPAGSPSFSAVTSRAAPDTTGVGDMLEAPRDGPKSLRVTGFEEVKSRKPKVAPKAPEPAETKRQRQQRKKREEEKERNAQSAKEHQAKGLQQMRVARMAEGTSNQTKADSFRPQENVWTAKDNNQSDSAVKQAPTNSSLTAPLDTFEPKPATDHSDTGAVATKSLSEIQDNTSSSANLKSLKNDVGLQKTSALAASERERPSDATSSLERTVSTTSWADLVDEEEEKKAMGIDDSGTWEEVWAKGKKKAKKVEGGTNGDSATLMKQVNGQHQKTAVPANANGASIKTQPVNRYKSLETEPASKDLEDSAWEA